MTTISLPPYDDDPSAEEETQEAPVEHLDAYGDPLFWIVEPGNAVDADLEDLYWRHFHVDDPAAARAALARIAAALEAWTAEVATWGSDDPQPLWCRGCGEYIGGEPCTSPSCAEPCLEPVVTDEVQAYFDLASSGVEGALVGRLIEGLHTRGESS